MNSHRFLIDDFSGHENIGPSVQALKQGLSGHGGEPNRRGIMEAFRVLVVEDKPDDILLLKRALEIVPDQVRIDLARNAREAVIYLEGLSAFGEALPGVAVLDLSTSHGEGLGLLKWMRERSQFAGTSILVLGDQTNAPEVDSAYALGATSFISKKSGPPEIVREVLRLCTEREQQATAKGWDLSELASIPPASMLPTNSRIPPTTTPRGPAI